jgi:hypothetical protein
MRPARTIATALSIIVAGCAPRPHIVATQSMALVPQQRTLAIAVDADTPLAFGLGAESVARAAQEAGFVIPQSGRVQYRLYLSAAIHPSKTGGLIPSIPPGQGEGSWLAHPRQSVLGAHNVARVTAVLVDVPRNREVWRGTAWRRSSKAAASVPGLTASVLAKLPRA